MVSIHRGQDSGLFLGTQDLTVPEDNLNTVDQGEMGIVINHDRTREFRNLHKLSLGVLDADVEHVTKLELNIRTSRRY